MAATLSLTVCVCMSSFALNVMLKFSFCYMFAVHVWLSHGLSLYLRPLMIVPHLSLSPSLSLSLFLSLSLCLSLFLSLGIFLSLFYLSVCLSLCLFLFHFHCLLIPLPQTLFTFHYCTPPSLLALIPLYTFLAPSSLSPSPPLPLSPFIQLLFIIVSMLWSS